MWNKFLIEHIDLFFKEIPNYEKFILAYIEPLDLTEESLSGYLRLMAKSFLQQCEQKEGLKEALERDFDLRALETDGSSYNKLLDLLKAMIQRAIREGYEVVFFLGEFDELDKFVSPVFYNNLKSIWEGLRPHLRFVFLSVEDLTTPDMTQRYGEFNAATLENVVYVPIRSGKDVDYLIDFFSERAEYDATPEEEEMVKQLSGGHPYIIKLIIKYLARTKSDDKGFEELKSELSENYELLSVIRRIYSLRSAKEKDLIGRIMRNEEVLMGADLSRLLKLGLVKEVNGKYEGFTKLLEKAIDSPVSTGTTPSISRGAEVHLNDAGEVVLNGNVSIEDRFTAQEFNVIKFLLEAKGKLQSREKISEILWGEESYEKYSDWAIDQVMSKIRKKLKELESSTHVITVRGRGYKFSSE